jgi:16S rRNA (cytidine1402-2'-O)-methyltransferase
VIRGTVSEVAAVLGGRETVKGEICLLVSPPGAAPAASDTEIEEALTEALRTAPPGEAAALVARRFGLPKRDVYARALALKQR